MNEPIRILGLDLGSKTIGIALSDELGWTAQPHDTLRRQSEGADLAALDKIVRAYGVEEIVVGYPLNMDGSVGPAARAAQRFALGLESTLGVKAHLWDERLSTVAVERVLIQGDLSRRKRRKVIDRAAAAYILQGFLDYRARQGEKPDA